MITDTLRRAWAGHPRLTLAFLLALLAAVLLGARLTFSVVYWSQHAHMAVAPWMTVGYVARSHGVDRREMFDALSGTLELRRGEPETLAEVAARLGLSEAEVTGQVESALARLKDDGRTAPAP